MTGVFVDPGVRLCSVQANNLIALNKHYLMRLLDFRLHGVLLLWQDWLRVRGNLELIRLLHHLHSTGGESQTSLYILNL